MPKKKTVKKKKPSKIKELRKRIGALVLDLRRLCHDPSCKHPTECPQYDGHNNGKCGDGLNIRTAVIWELSDALSDISHCLKERGLDDAGDTVVEVIRADLMLAILGRHRTVSTKIAANASTVLQKIRREIYAKMHVQVTYVDGDGDLTSETIRV